MSAPAPTIELPPQLYLLPAGEIPREMWRIHKAVDGAVHCNPRADHRFNDLRREYGVLYAATEPDGAFVEAVLRQGIGRDSEISAAFLALRKLSRLEIPRGLALVKLYDEGLARNRANAALTSGDGYAVSQAYSRALFDHPERPDGIAYRCRHDNGQMAFALFDRTTLIAHTPDSTLDEEEDLLRRLEHKYGFVVQA